MPSKSGIGCVTPPLLKRLTLNESPLFGTKAQTKMWLWITVYSINRRKITQLALLSGLPGLNPTGIERSIM